MRKLLIGLAILGLLLLAAPRSQVQAGGPCTVPKSWGDLRGITFEPSSMGVISYPMVMLEASDGTVRIVRADNCKAIETFTRSDN